MRILVKHARWCTEKMALARKQAERERTRATETHAPAEAPTRKHATQRSAQNCLLRARQLQGAAKVVKAETGP